MRQSIVTTRQVISRPRRIDQFRRRTWSSPRLRRTAAAEVFNVRGTIPGEFDVAPNPSLLRRSVGLASDIMILALLSPFFAGWFLYRGAMRLKRGEGRPQ